MKQILFIGGIFPTITENEILNNSRGNIQYAADTLQKAYLEGLRAHYDNIELCNLIYIGSYPRLYNKINVPSFHFQERTKYGHINGTNLGFNNIVLYKNYSRYNNLSRYLKKWHKNTNLEKIIIVYAAHTPFMRACANIKKEYPDTKIILIVPDLPEFMQQTHAFPNNIIIKYNSNLATKLYNYFDGFIFLSEQMKERINVTHKVFDVIEGIYYSKDHFKSEIRIEKLSENNSYITYTGTLAERYGILNLVNAFMSIKRLDIRLLIVGEGDAKDKILEYAKKDSRIIYKGQIPRQQVLEIQRQSSILVNPRTSEGEFTKYSFPSKTMEYLASGVPTVINRLPGIPQEYFNYSFQPLNESVEALSECLKYVLSLSQKEREIFGLKAQKFILEKKTPIFQCQKLVELIDKISI